ncbi:MAG: RidA family protein [Clostridia bacterium]|nr:RidA family protein [Clostridia bacterium]
MIIEKLKEMGLELPVCPAPVAAYLPVQTAGKLIYASGQTAWVKGELQYAGKVGGEVSIEEAYESAKLSALNCLSAIATVANLDEIRIVRVTGYVNAVPDFGEQPRVINGASELLQALYGENGRHARSAIGVGSLPTSASVEVEIIAERL